MLLRLPEEIRRLVFAHAASADKAALMQTCKKLGDELRRPDAWDTLTVRNAGWAAVAFSRRVRPFALELHRVAPDDAAWLVDRMADCDIPLQRVRLDFGTVTRVPGRALVRALGGHAEKLRDFRLHASHIRRPCDLQFRGSYPRLEFLEIRETCKASMRNLVVLMTPGRFPSLQEAVLRTASCDILDDGAARYPKLTKLAYDSADETYETARLQSRTFHQLLLSVHPESDRPSLARGLSDVCVLERLTLVFQHDYAVNWPLSRAPVVHIVLGLDANIELTYSSLPSARLGLYHSDAGYTANEVRIVGTSAVETLRALAKLDLHVDKGIALSVVDE